MFNKPIKIEDEINIPETLTNIIILIKHEVYLCASWKARQKRGKQRVIQFSLFVVRKQTSLQEERETFHGTKLLCGCL